MSLGSRTIRVPVFVDSQHKVVAFHTSKPFTNPNGKQKRTQVSFPHMLASRAGSVRAKSTFLACSSEIHKMTLDKPKYVNSMLSILSPWHSIYKGYVDIVVVTGEMTVATNSQ